MQTFVNRAYIKARLQLARRLQIIGFVILGGAFLLAFLPGGILGSGAAATSSESGAVITGTQTISSTLKAGSGVVSSSLPLTSSGVVSGTAGGTATAPATSGLSLLIYYIGLIVGFFVMTSGQWLNRKWKEEPHKKLVAELHDFNNRYVFYNYLPLSRALVLDHMIAGPGGFLVIQLQQDYGRIICRNNRWQRRVGFIDRIGSIGAPALGNPTLALDAQIVNLTNFLKAQGVANPMVKGAIVFSNDRAQIDIDGCKYPVFEHIFLSRFVREKLSFNEGDLAHESDEEQVSARPLSMTERTKVNSSLLALMGEVEEVGKQQEPVKGAVSSRTPVRTTTSRPTAVPRTASQARQGIMETARQRAEANRAKADKAKSGGK